VPEITRKAKKEGGGGKKEDSLSKMDKHLEEQRSWKEVERGEKTPWRRKRPRKEKGD